MPIEIEKIEEIYGSSVIELLKDEDMYQDFLQNILYLVKIGIEDVNEVVESYFLIFLCDHNEFVEKVNSLVMELGNNYIEKLGEDMSYWEELL